MCKVYILWYQSLHYTFCGIKVYITHFVVSKFVVSKFTHYTFCGIKVYITHHLYM